ncbi:hypothetical protein vBAspATola_15 [Aeromonas phage vB_AspA_Tola]|nr:hypothetical protein vBAspATola_15 [Aeromonas phage vB_AspA_Tola]
MSNRKLASHWLRVAEAYRQCAVSLLSRGPATYPNHMGALNAMSRAEESRDVAISYM